MHIPDAKRSKLDEKAAVGIFLGYGTLVKDSLVYDVNKGKMIISRNVKFDENPLWDWKSSTVVSDPKLEENLESSIGSEKF